MSDDIFEEWLNMLGKVPPEMSRQALRHSILLDMKKTRFFDPEVPDRIRVGLRRRNVPHLIVVVS